MADDCATAVTSEFDMDEGRAPKELRCAIPSLLSPTSKGIHSFGRALTSVSIVDRKGGYAS
jgi:hypothetical protein